MDSRYLTLNIIVRKYQIETTRRAWEGQDETELHSAKNIEKMASLIREAIPEAKLTWAISWYALFDTSDRYKEIRAAVKDMHERFGDDVTFIPGGYFANRYNTRDQVNEDISDALRSINDWIGEKPQTLIAGFLSATNIEYAREKEGIIAIQGNIWSQFAIDNMDGDGSICYPYYPSKQHFCKPAQDRPGTPNSDFIDCLNCDGWTVDFHNARIFNRGRGPRYNSRLGVGPIETLGNLKVQGLAEMQATTEAHYGLSAPYNPFTWITNNIELVLLEQIPNFPLFGKWLQWMRQRWPDVVCPTLREFATAFRREFSTNATIHYQLHQLGNGIGASDPREEIVWYMNQQFRLGILKDKKGREEVFDYTRYNQHYAEPGKLGVRNWSLMDLINQKQSRKQDQPIPKEKLKDWVRIQPLLK